MPNERLKWFVDRVGKIVYRNRTTCDCPVCENVYKTGLYINDRFHAEYVYDMECMYSKENIPVKYFDTKKEVDDFEKSING